MPPSETSQSANRRIRVLIVDDSAFMRRAIQQMIGGDAELEVVGIATNGQEAIVQAVKLKPDVITLDIEMPVMNGLEAIPKLKNATTPPPAILVCSSLTSAGSHEALKALRLGASDVIAKDSSNFSLSIEKIKDDLIAKIKAVAVGKRASIKTHEAAAKGRIDRTHTLQRGAFDLLVIGSSTGGPPVLETILSALPADLSVPVVVAQHMPLMFTKSLAERLDEVSAVSVIHGEQGMPLHPGTVYIGQGGKHVRVNKSLGGKLTLEISPEPAAALYKPAVNELYASAAKASGSRCAAVILTGMGDDGAIGAKDLRAKGALILAQDLESCVVYGMPKAVAQAGLADASLPPADIATILATLGTKTAAKAA